MNEFIVLPPEEKRLYIEQAALRAGLVQPVVEKDFWVCWILGKLFSLADIRDHLIFKGGTSLSKAYGLIQRFSEDVDVSIDRRFLGFDGKDDPFTASSRTARERILGDLQTRCTQAVRDKLLPALRSAISEELSEGWELEIDPDDPLAILFHFPDAIGKALFSYITPYVKVELGARGDGWPQESKEIRSYLAEALPGSFAEEAVPATTLAPERTFWEKATILHMEYHRPEGKELPARLSRHYYDLHMLYTSPVGQKALEDIALLERVVRHKRIFFASGWAHYDEILSSGLKLIPPPGRRESLAADYQKMREMFFSEPPQLEIVYESLGRLEKAVTERLAKC